MSGLIVGAGYEWRAVVVWGKWHVECDGVLHGDELPRKIAAGLVEESACRS